MNRYRSVLLALIGVLAQPYCLAQDEVTVYSARADSVAVTIYPNDLALITETRTVELPESPATLVIEDVADTLLPQSVVVNGLGRPLVESNFDYNRLSPESLLAQSIGETVTLMRANPATGSVTRVSATVISAGEGVVLEVEGANEALYCSGMPEGIVFDAIPDDLSARPELSMRIPAGESGERMLRVSYLAHGFEWTADYVAKLDAGAERLDLVGWATITNASSRAFGQAELQLVAGQLNVLPDDQGGSAGGPAPANPGESQVDARERLAEESELTEALLLRECFDAEPPEFEPRFSELIRFAPDDDIIVVTGARIHREEFGDYHLYRLPWLTNLGARQTKQVRFLERDDVTVERFYALYADGVERPGVYGERLEFGEGAGRSPVVPPSLMVRTENTEENGLGEPMPGGAIRFFEAYGDRSVFTGQAVLADRPAGAGIELDIGYALDLLVEVDFQSTGGGRVVLDAEYRASSNKTSPVDLEIRHFTSGETDLVVEESSVPYAFDTNSFGNSYLAWRLVVPPGAETLRYRLSAAD